MNLEEVQVNSQVMFYEFVAFILLQVSELQIAQRLQEDILYLYRPGCLFLKVFVELLNVFKCKFFYCLCEPEQVLLSIYWAFVIYKID